MNPIRNYTRMARRSDLKADVFIKSVLSQIAGALGIPEAELYGPTDPETAKTRADGDLGSGSR